MSAATTGIGLRRTTGAVFVVCAVAFAAAAAVLSATFDWPDIGALLGEHLGQLLVIGWSVTISLVILRTGVLPHWLGVTPTAVRPATAGLRS